jgi:hypothetical protein
MSASSQRRRRAAFVQPDRHLAGPSAACLISPHVPTSRLVVVAVVVVVLIALGQSAALALGLTGGIGLLAHDVHNRLS